MATGPEHYLEAERMRAEASEWMDADLGWKANLTARERIDLRIADLADAQVHATLALAAATAMAARQEPGMHDLDFEAWDHVAGVQEDDATAAAEPEAYLDSLDDGTPVKFTVNGPGDYIAEAIAEHDPRTCVECVEQHEAEQSAGANDGDLIGAVARHSSIHGTAAVYDTADPHDAALAEQARIETSTYFAAFDAERHAEENAANHYADEHYNTQDDEDDEPVDGAL